MTLRGGVLWETTPSSMAASRFKFKSDNCVRGNSLLLSGYGTGSCCTRSLVRILPEPYISAMHLLICFFVTDFVHKNFPFNVIILILHICFTHIFFQKEKIEKIITIDEYGMYG